MRAAAVSAGLKCLNYCARMAAETSLGHRHVVRAIKEDGWMDGWTDGWMDGGTARRDIALLGPHPPTHTHTHTHTHTSAPSHSQSA